MRGKTSREVTFRDFARLAQKRGWTVVDLVDLVGSEIDDARGFFERVLSCRVKKEGRFEDRGNVVILYRSVLRFYFKELNPEGQGVPASKLSNPLSCRGRSDDLTPKTGDPPP